MPAPPLARLGRRPPSRILAPTTYIRCRGRVRGCVTTVFTPFHVSRVQAWNRAGFVLTAASSCMCWLSCSRGLNDTGTNMMDGALPSGRHAHKGCIERAVHCRAYWPETCHPGSHLAGAEGARRLQQDRGHAVRAADGEAGLRRLRQEMVTRRCRHTCQYLALRLDCSCIKLTSFRTRELPRTCSLHWQCLRHVHAGQQERLAAADAKL